MNEWLRSGIMETVLWDQLLYILAGGFRVEAAHSYFELLASLPGEMKPIRHEKGEMLSQIELFVELCPSQKLNDKRGRPGEQGITKGRPFQLLLKSAICTIPGKSRSTLTVSSCRGE